MGPSDRFHSPIRLSEVDRVPVSGLFEPQQHDLQTIHHSIKAVWVCCLPSWTVGFCEPASMRLSGKTWVHGGNMLEISSPSGWEIQRLSMCVCVCVCRLLRFLLCIAYWQVSMTRATCASTPEPPQTKPIRNIHRGTHRPHQRRDEAKIDALCFLLVGLQRLLKTV